MRRGKKEKQEREFIAGDRQGRGGKHFISGGEGIQGITMSERSQDSTARPSDNSSIRLRTLEPRKEGVQPRNLSLVIKMKCAISESTSALFHSKTFNSY